MSGGPLGEGRRGEDGRRVIRLWLDDVRDPVRFGRIGWTWAKTYDEAVALLTEHRVIEASLDHDLSIDDTLGTPKGAKTGYDLVCWMEQHGIWPERVTVHSMNPSGAQRMRLAVERAGVPCEVRPAAA